MRKRIIALTIASLFPITLTTAQFVLQPWVQVFGTVDGQQLGKYVTGITPSANLPYRAAVSMNGSTSFFRLRDSTDILPQLTLPAEGPIFGDLNNDGYTDVVMTTTVNGWGTVLVYWGSAAGIDTLNPLRIPGEHQNDFFGARCVGDINSDGRTDLIITGPAFVSGSNRGKIYVFLNPITSTLPQASIVGDSIESGLGVNCAVADLNNDGFQDLAARGIYHHGPQSARYDYINIYWGIGIDTVNLTLGMQLRGYNLNSSALACFDANGDGIADLLWTNRDGQGDWVYIHYGGVAFDTIPGLKLQDPGVANFGNAIINAGDMNGDGHDDILVAAYRATNTSGFVFVFGGGPQIDGTFDAAVGMDSDSDFGVSVSSVGDVSGDGLSDIIVGAPAYDFAISNKGYWGIFKGDSAIRVTPVKEGEQLPRVMTLHQAYPNPFNPQTTIRYDLNRSATVTLEVFNVLGQRVTLLVHGGKVPGSYEAVLDGSGLASGAYLYRWTARTQDGRTYTDTKRLTLVK